MTSKRLTGIDISLIRQINALATPLTINLGIGEPNVEPDETLRAIAAEAAQRASWHYSANAGIPKLRALIAPRYAGLDAQQEICVTAGTQEALFAVMQAWVDPGDEVLVPDPGFLSYATVARICGGEAVPYALDPPTWTIDVARLEERITPRTRMIVINSPSNPTGGVLDGETLDTVAAIAEKRGIIVLSDEVYRAIHYGPPPASMHGRTNRAIVIDGLSKSHAMTGLRLGWVAAKDELLKPVITAHQYIATCASVLSQEIAIAIFERPEWNERWLASLRERFVAQQDAAMFAAERALHVELPRPGGAFYLFAPVPSCDTITLAKALATEAAVLTIPGVAFGMHGEGFLRISYAADPKAIQHGIERIGTYLAEHGR